MLLKFKIQRISKKLIAFFINLAFQIQVKKASQMLQKTILLLIFVLFISCKNESSTTDKMTDSNWLLGKWTTTLTQGNLEETWKTANDSTYEATSYFIKERDTLHNEAIVLQQLDENLIYKATIKGQNNDQPILFPLTEATDKSVTFENPKHDYPQKIKYQLVNESTLSVTISGIQAGKPSSESYTLKKTE